jgi:hypothetical protein
MTPLVYLNRQLSALCRKHFSSLEFGRAIAQQNALNGVPGT